jgi:hypothetical protein
MDTATNMANAFEAEANVAPVVNVSGVDAPTATGTPEPTSTQKFYTEEDLARVRSQEKSKLYPEIDSLKERLASFEREKEEEAARKAAEAQAEAERAKAAAESELDAKSLLDLRTKELQEQLERERQERERAFALLERERTFADLQAYRQQVLEANRDNIMPQLVKYVQGNTQEEIDASVADVVAQTSDILASTQEVLQNQRREMKGTSITTPPAGPLETNSEQRMLTPQEIAGMSMNEYAKYRDKIMSSSARGQSRGILG